MGLFFCARLCWSSGEEESCSADEVYKVGSGFTQGFFEVSIIAEDNVGIEERAVGSPEGAGVFKYFAPSVGADGRIQKLITGRLGYDATIVRQCSGTYEREFEFYDFTVSSVLGVGLLGYGAEGVKHVFCPVFEFLPAEHGVLAPFWGHPHIPPVKMYPALLGSTPHAWGKVSVMSPMSTPLGLNPIYAGKLLPGKALHLQGVRIVFAFPLWGE